MLVAVFVQPHVCFGTDGSRLVQAEEVGWGQGGQADVALDPPTMRQAIAWSFALRNIRRQEAEEVGEQLRRETGAEAVRDVKARLSVLETVHLGWAVGWWHVWHAAADA